MKIIIKSFIAGRIRLQIHQADNEKINADLQGLIDADILQSNVYNPLTHSFLLKYNVWLLTKRDIFQILNDTLTTSKVWRNLPEIGTCDGIDETADPGGNESSAEPENCFHWQILSNLPGRLRANHPAIKMFDSVAKRLKGSLVNIEGIEQFKVTPETSNILVFYDQRCFANAQALIDVLNEIVESTLADCFDNGQRPTGPTHDESFFRLTCSSTILAMTSIASWLPGIGVLARYAMMISSTNIFYKASQSVLVERKLKVDVLDAVVVSLALAYHRNFAAAVMIWVVDISESLLKASSEASNQKLTEIFGKQVRTTTRIVDSKEEQCSVHTLQLGDLVVVRSGDQIPVDGIIVDGSGMVDQSALTGEYAPIEKFQDEKLFAMTNVLAGKVTIEVTETGNNTNAAKIIDIIDNSMQHKVHLQSVGERLADNMVMPTLSLGGIGYLFFGPNPMMAIINADFGTGIRIAGPLAILSSLSVSAKNGILIKNGAVLESLTKMDAIIFDKTGTLTDEMPKVSKIYTLTEQFDEEKVLAWTAAAEHRFTHPIARAIRLEAFERGIDIPQVSASDALLGLGIQVRIDGHELQVGSKRFMRQNHVELDNTAQDIDHDIASIGGTAVYIAIDGILCGIFALQASARAEAAEVIKMLKEKRHISKIYLISGDRESPTKALANQLGIDHYFAEVLPEEKGKYVKQLQDEGYNVCMVGDGINDSIALSQADYSISLRGAADAATDISDVIFLDGNLKKFELLLNVSDNLVNNVHRSFMLTVIPNTFLISGALLGAFGLTTSLIFNNMFNLVATYNGTLSQKQLGLPRPAQEQNNP